MHDFALDVHNCAYFCCYTDFAAVLTCGHQGLQINREKNWSMDKELRFIIISYSFCSCADVQSAQGTNYLGNHFTGLFTHLSCCCWSAWTPAAVMTLWEYKWVWTWKHGSHAACNTFVREEEGGVVQIRNQQWRSNVQAVWKTALILSDWEKTNT